MATDTSFRWILKMAWRDSRHTRKRLALYMSAIIMGVAALVSVRSFGENLLDAVEEQAKILLGADLAVRSRTGFTPEAEELLEELGGEQSRQVSFSSMAIFPRQGGTRLVQVRALDGEFPYYSKLETEPAAAEADFRKGPYALVDHTLMLQFGVETGDPLKLGTFSFEILGRLKRIPGEMEAASDFAPRIFIPLEFLEETGLIQRGSRVRYSAFLKLPAGTDAEKIVEDYEARFDELELSTDTIEERKERFGRQLSNLNRFLSLVAFIAIVLGGIGVASSIHLYVRQRVGTIAILRCLGSSVRQSFSVYVVQSTLMGLLGAFVGLLVGLAVQRVLPMILGDLIPIDLEPAFAWSAALEGLLVGFGTALLFALIPLLPIRRVSPLSAIRVDYEASAARKRDPLQLLAFALLLAALLGFSLWHTSRWSVGLGFFFGLLTVFGLLFAVARTLMFLTRKYFPSSWKYEWRQGLVNLYRPHNQTVVLILAVGLGTFFIVTLYLVQISLLEEVEFVGAEGRPNLILFDIQNDQVEAVKELIDRQGLRIIEEVPVVTMRLAAINGVSVSELREVPGRRDWPLLREYRSTYRSTPSETEKVIRGRFQGAAAPDGTVEVSLEQGIAEDLQVDVGDELVFDILGVSQKTRVGSIREVEWQNFRPNFFVVFPTGVLEEAPQFHVLVTRTESAEKSASLQREAVSAFPNISAIDLSLVIETVESILDKLSFVIQFMALFSMVTGLIVLTGAIVSGRYQRMKESVLLRTLGASRRQIRQILFIEYFFLGLFAASTGILLAIGAGWAITYFMFEAGFVLDPVAVGLAFSSVILLTLLIGVINTRGILEHPPLEVLRAED